ncbi:MAG: hypothetical protein C0462_11410 [Alcanivorax sp.]|nr:hypothetical protein [Alcanivorax sp.]
MSVSFTRLLVCAGLCLLALPASAGNSPGQPASAWGEWLRQQVSRHPDVRAAAGRLQAAHASADDLSQPLYNPELATAYEREGRDNNYQIGLSQTIDLWGKRDRLSQQAGFSRAAAEQAYRLAVQEKIAATLAALTRWEATRALADLATEQEQQLDTMIRLLEARERAGDLSQMDAELTWLALARNLHDTATAQADARRAEAALRELLPGMPDGGVIIPDAFWQWRGAPSGERLDQHPRVAAAHADWQVLRQAAALSDRSQRADPTVGISAGRSGEDDVLGVALSIPLNLRNTYKARHRAAEQAALAAEADYQAVRRQQRYTAEGVTAALEAYRHRAARWQTLVGTRIADSAHLLQQQWRRGDLSTLDYLQALQQRADGIRAGIALRQAERETHTEWLLQTGQLDDALNAL